MSKGILVIPCYNEARRLDVRVFEEFVRDDDTFALLFVDDGSTDATPQVLQELCAANPERISCHILARNGGKAEAVRQGILLGLERDPEMIGYWDADLATPLRESLAMVRVFRKRPDVQMVVGARVRMLGRTIERRWKRHYAGRLFATCASLVLGVAVYDTQCGAKLFRVTPDTAAVFSEPFHSRWIFDVELMARYLSRCGSSSDTSGRAAGIYEYPLREWRDVGGSKLRMGHFAKAALDLVGIWIRYRHAKSEPPARAGEEVSQAQ